MSNFNNFDDKENDSTFSLDNVVLEQYEKNEFMQAVINDLKQFFVFANCTCHNKREKCFKEVGFEAFLERHLEFQSLEKKQLEFVLMGQLLAFLNNDKNNPKKYFFNYHFNFKISLCKNTYLKLVGIKDETLRAIKHHLLTEGLMEWQHENMRNLPKVTSRVTIDQELATIVYNFIINYANIYGFPSPGRHMQTDSLAIILLPTEKNYTRVYEDFVTTSRELDSNISVISYKSFVRLWKSLTPHIKFMTSATDLCDVCEILKKKIQYAKNPDEKSKIGLDLKNHKNEVEKEWQYYNNNITISNTHEEIAHICHDWAQNVLIPFSPQQVDQIYFKTAFAVHIFSVCNTKQQPFAQQLNYIIDEDEFLNRTAEKGANITINLVFNALSKFYQREQHLKVTCDNCTGQNKNNLSLFFWS